MMSGGEKKFIYIVILLSVERDWYILDEPFAFLDGDKKDIIWKMINEKISEEKGIILTSHEHEINRLNKVANIVDMDMLENEIQKLKRDFRFVELGKKLYYNNQMMLGSKEFVKTI